MSMEIVKNGEQDNCVLVAVKGRIDAVTAPEFDKQVGEWVDADTSDFIVDLSELDYISSAGLRSILGVAKRLRGNERELTLCSLKDTVREVFDISGFRSIIPIFDSVEAALKER